MADEFVLHGLYAVDRSERAGLRGSLYEDHNFCMVVPKGFEWTTDLGNTLTADRKKIVYAKSISDIFINKFDGQDTVDFETGYVTTGVKIVQPNLHPILPDAPKKPEIKSIWIL